MNGELKGLLWRVIYTPRARLNSDGFCAGPWHPDKAHVERCATSLRRLMKVGVQSNQQALRGAAHWPSASER